MILTFCDQSVILSCDTPGAVKTAELRFIDTGKDRSRSFVDPDDAARIVFSFDPSAYRTVLDHTAVDPGDTAGHGLLSFRVDCQIQRQVFYSCIRAEITEETCYVSVTSVTVSADRMAGSVKISAEDRYPGEFRSGQYDIVFQHYFQSE